MNILQNMRVFVRVVETGSFTAAAESMNSTTSATSRAVKELEAHLRARLINRSTRRLALTTAGERYRQRCVRILADVDTAEDEASRAHERPAGSLRMHSFASVGQRYVIPAVCSYRSIYPDVTVDLTLLEKMPDLFDGSSDVAIVTAPTLPDSDLVSVVLGSTFNILCATPDYLSSRGAPRKPSDLLTHDCLVLQSPTCPTSEWVLETGGSQEAVRVNGPMRVNIAESLTVAIKAGMGIGTLPLYTAIDDLKNGTLVRVLTNHILNRMYIYVLYPSRRFTDAKTITWTKFLRTHIPEVIARDEKALEALSGALEV